MDNIDYVNVVYIIHGIGDCSPDLWCVQLKDLLPLPSLLHLLLNVTNDITLRKLGMSEKRK